MNARYLFVGERRSPTAIRLNVTWRDGRLAAKTLFAALCACGIEPADQEYVNLWHDDQTCWREDRAALALVADRERRGVTVVALGRLVSARLSAAGISHRTLIHPAARGAIRRRDRYQAHVRDTLTGVAA